MESLGGKSAEDGSAHPGMQLNLMNSRVIDLIAHTRERWPLAGDQLFVDLNLTPKNLPTGTQLNIGSAVIEITEIPHLGCAKFVERFEKDAMIFVNSRRGKKLNLRGINVKARSRWIHSERFTRILDTLWIIRILDARISNFVMIAIETFRVTHCFRNPIIKLWLEYSVAHSHLVFQTVPLPDILKRYWEKFHNMLTRKSLSIHFFFCSPTNMLKTLNP